MQIKMTMRKKIILFFIGLVTLPVLTIYFIVSNLFISNAQKDMTTIYAAGIREVGKSVNALFDSALDLTIYPLMEQNLKLYLTTPKTAANYNSLKQNASSILLTMPYGYSSGIHGVSISTVDDDFISTNVNTKLTASDIKIADKQNAAPYWDYSDVAANNDYLFLTRLLRNPSNISQSIGYIKLSLSCGKIRDTILQNQQDQQTAYFMVTKDSHYILQPDYVDPQNDVPSLHYPELLQLAVSDKNSTIIDNRIVSAYALNHNDLIIYSITKSEVLSMVKKSFFLNMTITSLLVLIFSLLLSIAFSKIIINPLHRLGQSMKSISNEDFTVRYPIKGTDELSIVAQHFNEMAERLEFLYSEVYMGELKLKQSQLTMLQTQINPHFLYNTLDTIYWMSRMGENSKVSIMVSNMSKMMRLTLAPKTNDKIPLSQELEHLSCYINIQQIRYGQNIVFELTCDEIVKNEYVLSFLLQPLVENALVHGLSNFLHGTVSIHIYELDHQIVYEVGNDGSPINELEISTILNTADSDMKGFALRNINERIKLKYGLSYCLSCYKEGRFSIFKIIQPKEDSQV